MIWCDRLLLWYYDNVWSLWSRSFIYKLWWKFNHRFVRRHQYNRLDTGLPPGYYDPATQILYAVMNSFRNYMEEGASAFCYGNEAYENYVIPYTNVDGTVDEEGVKRYEEKLEKDKQLKLELDTIYEWWVNRYLKTHEIHEAYWKSYVKGIPNSRKIQQAMFNLAVQLEEEADEQLARLMKHRQNLWYA